MKRTTKLVAALAATVAVGCGGGQERGGSTSSGSTSGGGSTSGATVNGQFATINTLGTARVGHSATLIPGNGPLGGKVLIAGGLAKVGAGFVALDSAELYDPATGDLTPVQGRMSTARAGHGAGANALGNVTLVGGHSDVAGSTAIRSLENFESTSRQFRVPTSSQLAEAKAEPMVLTFAHQGAQRLLAAGGRVGTSARASGDVFLADTISTVGRSDFRTARYGAEAVQLPSGKVFAAGGLTTAVELYDPASGTAGAFAAAAGSLAQVRFRSGVALAGDKAIVIGGRQDETSFARSLDTIEVYNETTATFQLATQKLPVPMSGFATAKLQNGAILLIGGVNGSGVVLDTAIAITGSGVDVVVSQLANRMRVARKDPKATVLANGTVLVTGGSDANGNPVKDVELFVFTASQIPVRTPPTGTAIPTITALNPTSGAVGTTVTIAGTGFSMTPSDNRVTFSGVLAPVQTVLSGTSGSVELRVVVPPQLANGAHPVVVEVATRASAAQTFTVGTTGGSGTGTGTGTGGTSSFGGPPHILFAIPSSGPSFMPVVITGSRFADPTIPFVNGTPSISIFNFGFNNIPLIGSFSFGTTLVPVAAPSGAGSLQVEHYGLRSNLYPFTKN